VQDVQSLKLLQQNSIAQLDFATLQRVIRASINQVYEFPPLDGGFPPGKNWTKDLNDLYPGSDGQLYAKYKFTVTNASSIMPGTYAAYSNSIWDYSNSTLYGSVEWPPSAAFDKIPANETNIFPGWNQRSGDATTRRLIIQLPTPILFRGYSLEHRSDVWAPTRPNQIVLYDIHGSRDGLNWTLLDARNFTGYNWTSGEVKSFNVSVQLDLFQYFRFSTNQPYPDDYKAVSIGEWRLFGSME
jgi:hypothetical protein